MDIRLLTNMMFPLVVALIAASYIHGSSAADPAHSGTAGLWQYQAASSNQPSPSPYGTHHDFSNIGQRQTSLSSPLVSFLPMLVLFGIGAVIVISILYFIFNPFGLTSLLSPAAYGGTPSYGRKRSLDQFPMQQYIMDLVTQVAAAIEKYDKPTVNTSPPSTAGSKNSSKKNGSR